MNKTINLRGRNIGHGYKPFIITELSGNHQQSYELALKMIEAAAEAGVDAIKLQTYTADSMTLDIAENEFLIQEQSSLWKGESLHALYQKAATPYEWHEGLFKRADDLGLLAFSSPFDEAAVDFLETLNVPCYKIASFENTDLSLIRKAASTGKPLIISTGMASLIEIEETVSAAQEADCKDIVLLKCTSNYPAPPEDINLATIPDLAKHFDCVTGLSDHTRGTEIAVASVALGASVIEKHFVLDRTLGGVDAEFSLEPAEMKNLVDQSQCVFHALGKVNYGETPSDSQAKRYRRSVYVAADISAGECLTTQNIRIIRPGLGLAPKYFDELLGRKAKQFIAKGTPASWDLFTHAD